ncbi:unnamed protein product [Tilletia laevis]|uniref:Uncharacterized protein n=2 Tax=Tilletia TaxID=13289 RepID=A0A177UDA5_9BASI|nr:hypothetical protein CF336_g2755 [Tilletia laevis]KAE8262818.1 hypothetical protein A4X03_0g2152 [Tilletia caries]KAE8203704.1 hypothetical protein CF335_g2923 [Tilletia laevis]CAD6888834.1 unnamed protein product [Tilletia caries]CAD6901537.1 unnamed protein product [Tilletia caries]
MPATHKRQPDEVETADAARDPDFYVPPPKRAHLNPRPQTQHPRRHRSHSAAFPFTAFSKLNISPQHQHQHQHQQQLPQPTLYQPTPIRPQQHTRPPAAYDIDTHRTILTSLDDDDDDDDDITLRSRSPSPTPPASPHFTLNPALAAQLAANHPFASKASSVSINDLSSPFPAAPSDWKPGPGALILYKPVTPKAAFVRPEDEEREDEDDDAVPTQRRVEEPLIEEIDEEVYLPRAQSRRSTRPGLPHSASSSSSLRIIELDDNDDELEADQMRDRRKDGENDEEGEEDLLYPSYYVESPSSPGLSTASTPTSSSHHNQHNPSVIDLSQPQQHLQGSIYFNPPPQFNSLGPVVTNLAEGAGAESESHSSSFPATPMSLSTTGSNTPVSYTPLHPSLLATANSGGDEEAPMDLD